MFGDAPRCDDASLVKPSGEPHEVSLSRGYLDYVLLRPDGWDGQRLAVAPPALTASIIDAKATEKVKLGAKVQVAYYSLPKGAKDVLGSPLHARTLNVQARLGGAGGLTEEGSILLCLRRGANTHLVPVRRLRQQLYPGREQIPVL